MLSKHYIPLNVIRLKLLSGFSIFLVYTVIILQIRIDNSKQELINQQHTLFNYF